MEVKAVSPEEFMEELESLIKQSEKDKYSLQVGLEDVKFTFDEQRALALEVGPGVSSIEKGEVYLREGILAPVELIEYDGTVHQVREWDPTPVGYSGFMDCVTHSIVVTDQGTFEVGRYPAMNIQTFSKVWQWFIHRKIEGSERD